MPIYDMQCAGCGKEEEVHCKIEARNDVACMECGERMVVLITMRSRPVLFRAGFYENITDKPIYCETPQQLRDACDEHDGISRYLEDSNFKTSPGEGEAKWSKQNPRGRVRRKRPKPTSPYRVVQG